MIKKVTFQKLVNNYVHNQQKKKQDKLLEKRRIKPKE